MKFIGVKHRFPKLWPHRWSIRSLFFLHPNFGVQDDHHLGPPSPGNPPNFRYFRNFVPQTVAFWRLILSRPASSVSPRSRDHRGSTVSFDRSEKKCLSRKISSPKAHRVGQIFAKMWEFCMIQSLAECQLRLPWIRGDCVCKSVWVVSCIGYGWGIKSCTKSRVISTSLPALDPSRCSEITTMTAT